MSSKGRFSINDLRFNPSPPPIKGGREFSKSPLEAFLKIEDILSHYALGNIDLEYALQALNYARNAVIPKLNYPQDTKDVLIQLYNEAINLLRRLGSRERVKEWLLGKGPPRSTYTMLDKFIKK